MGGLSFCTYGDRAAPVGVPSGMTDMIDVTVSTKINRSADVVFAYMSNIANAPSWRTDVMEVSQTSAGPTGAGAAFHLRLKPAMGCTALGFWDTGLNPMLPLRRVEAGSGGRRPG